MLRRLNVADVSGLVDMRAVQLLQDEAQLLLFKYVRCVRADDQSRFGKLLLTLPCLRASASSAAVSTLFFADTIGAAVPAADRIVTDIYRQMAVVSTADD